MGPLLATHPYWGRMLSGAGLPGGGEGGTTSEEVFEELDATSEEVSEKLGKGPSGVAGCATGGCAAAPCWDGVCCSRALPLLPSRLPVQPPVLYFAHSRARGTTRAHPCSRFCIACRSFVQGCASPPPHNLALFRFNGATDVSFISNAGLARVA